MKPYDANHAYAFVASNYGSKDDNGFEVLVVDKSTCNSNWCKVSTARPKKNYNQAKFAVVSNFFHKPTHSPSNFVDETVGN